MSYATWASVLRLTSPGFLVGPELEFELELELDIAYLEISLLGGFEAM
jgi:hypothetical protein